jgi:hypothetical protein
MLAAIRRLVILIVGCSIVVAGISALFGALIGASLDRAVALGFYGLGCFLMVSGFFVGNRGPARVKSETAGSSMLPLPGMGDRRLRWATLDEQNETINNSAIFIVLGLVLVLIGVVVDSHHSLV